MHKYGSISLKALMGQLQHDRTAEIYFDGAAVEWALDTLQLQVRGSAISLPPCFSAIAESFDSILQQLLVAPKRRNVVAINIQACSGK